MAGGFRAPGADEVWQLKGAVVGARSIGERLHEGRALVLRCELCLLRRRTVALSPQPLIQASIDWQRWEVVWSVSLKKELGDGHMGVGQYCGDGSFFGCAVAERKRSYTLVLETGAVEVVHRHQRTEYGMPHSGKWVRSDATRPDTLIASTLDLATGEIGEVTLPTGR